MRPRSLTEGRRRGAARPIEPKTVDPARKAWRWIVEAVYARREYMQVQATRYGLTLPQAHLLRVLGSGPSYTTTSLAKALACDASNITGLIDRLESRALIERAGMSGDRRVKILRLTSRGTAVISQLNRTMLEPPAGLARLARRELASLASLLAKAFADSQKPSTNGASRVSRRGDGPDSSHHGTPSNSKSV